MIKRNILSILILAGTALFGNTQVNAQQLELSSSSYSTTVKGPLQSAGPATLLKNTGTSSTFTTYTPTTTFSVSLSNQQYTSGTVPGVTIGQGTNVFKPLTADGSPSSSFFTSSPNSSTAGTNFDVAANHGFVFDVESKYQYDNNQPLTARNRYADLTITFNRAVINPVLHFSGMGGGTIVTTYNGNGQLTGEGIVGFYTEFELSAANVSSGITVTRLSGNTHFAVNNGTKILNSNTAKSLTGGYYNTQQYASAGSVRVNSGGTPITSVTFRIFLRGDGGTGYPSDWNWSSCMDSWMLSASLGLAHLSGTVYTDNNGMINGVDGTPMAGVTVGLYENNGTTLLGTTTTNTNGYYLFTEIPAGAYVVKVTAPAGYNHVSSTDTTPTDGITSVKHDGITDVNNIDFGLRLNQIDLGDAPNTYGTLLKNNGPSHTIGSPLKLGALVDAELDAFPNANANGDDTNDTDDEDGLSTIPSLSINSTSYQLNVAVSNTTGVAAYLTGWVDFNRNGIFDTTEKVTVTVPQNATSAILKWSSLPGITGGTSYIRLRLSTDNTAVSVSGGAAKDGEVEDYRLDIIASPLPVTLTFFTATKIEANSQLLWATTQESNSDYFEIQHSRDAKSWTVVGNVAAAGESKTAMHYEFIHHTPTNGANYYRLKMIDQDATSAYSRTVSTHFNRVQNVSVYPNPVSSLLMIKNGDQQVIKTVEIIDISGKTVYLNKNESSLSDILLNGIDISKILAGTYIVRVSGADGMMWTNKIMVIH